MVPRADLPLTMRKMVRCSGVFAHALARAAVIGADDDEPIFLMVGCLHGLEQRADVVICLGDRFEIFK